MAGPDTEAFRGRLLSVPHVVHAAKFHHGLKISPMLHASLLPADPAANKTKEKLLVHLGEEYFDSLEQVQLALEEWRGRVAGLTAGGSGGLRRDESFDGGDSVGVVFKEETPWLVSCTIYYNPTFAASSRAPSPQLLPTVLAFLSTRNEVHWIERDKTFRSANKFARDVLETNEANNSLLLFHGLTGEGEVVAIGDTGVDYDSCYFHDPKETVRVGRGKPPNFNHRKLVSYVVRTQFYRANARFHSHRRPLWPS